MIDVRKVLFSFLLLGFIFPSALAATKGQLSSAEHIINKQDFRDARSDWGFQIGYGSGAFGLDSQVVITPGIENPSPYQVHDLEVSVEWQPIQEFGILGIGVGMDYFPTTPVEEGVSADLKNGWAWSGKVRYQFNYARNQIIVPTAAYHLALWNYKLADDQSGYFVAHGPGAGLWLNLSALDTTTANEVYKSTGIARFYLTFEAKRLLGGDGSFSLSATQDRPGWKYLIGLRTEL